MIALSGEDVSGLKHSLVDVLDHGIEILSLRLSVILDKDKLMDGGRKHIEASADCLSSLLAEVGITGYCSALETALVSSDIGYDASIFRSRKILFLNEVLDHVTKRCKYNRLICKRVLLSISKELSFINAVHIHKRSGNDHTRSAVRIGKTVNVDIYDKRHIRDHLVRSILKHGRIAGNHSQIGVILNILVVGYKVLNFIFLVLDHIYAFLDSINHLENCVINVFAILNTLVDLLKPECHRHLCFTDRYLKSFCLTIW